MPTKTHVYTPATAQNSRCSTRARPEGIHSMNERAARPRSVRRRSTGARPSDAPTGLRCSHVGLSGTEQQQSRWAECARRGRLWWCLARPCPTTPANHRLLRMSKSHPSHRPGANQHARTHARTHKPARTHARINLHARKPSVLHAPTHTVRATHACTHPQTHTRACTPAPARERACAPVQPQRLSTGCSRAWHRAACAGFAITCAQPLDGMRWREAPGAAKLSQACAPSH